MADPKLVVVRRGQFATFELLTRTFAGDPEVSIIWDRRMGERRKTPRGRDLPERRSADRRRIPPTQWAQLNYMIASDASSN